MSDDSTGTIDETMSLLGEFYGPLDLLAPGDNTLTKEAFHRILPLPDRPFILDIGCGTGRSTMALAELCPGARIEAIDIYQVFLDRLSDRAAEAGYKIATHLLPMEKLAEEIEEESVDLIWSEGSAYIMGFEKALKAWRDLLRPNGAMVVSELCWNVEDPPEEAKVFWDDEYPDMVGVEEAVFRANDAGLSVFDTITLPVGAFQAYYGALEDRCDALEPKASPAMADLIRTIRREIDIFGRFKGSFSYVLFLMRKD